MLLVSGAWSESVRWSCCRRGRHGDEGRADDAVAEAIAAPDLLDDLAVGPAGAGHVAIASCSRGSNGRPGVASMAVTPSLSSRSRSLRSMAAMPSNHGSVGDRLRPRLDGAVEVVGDGQHLADAGPRRRGRASRSRSSAVRRLKFWNSARSRCRARRGTRRPVASASSRSLGEGLDLGEQRGRRDVDLVRALLAARVAVPVRHRGGPPVRS